MSAAWVLKWDTHGENAAPVVAAPGAALDGPAVFRGEAGTLVLFDGYLFDRRELGSDPRASNAALVAAAYERWQDALVEKLRGGFAFAVWDGARRRLLVARDAMGLVPCYYSWDGRRFLAASALDVLLSQPEVDGRFNRVVLAEYVQDWLSLAQAHETFYEAIRRLPPAHTLSLREGTLTLARYWDPVPPGFAWASEDELARFPQVLERAVRRGLDVGADSVSLSGGFDSISVAVVAAAQRDGQAPLHALSVRFTDTPCDEGATQAEVATTLGMPLLMRTIPESLDGAGPVETVLALSGASPSPVLSPWQAMHTGLLRAAAGLGLSRVLMGSGGDDMFNVDLGYGADRVAALDLPGLCRFYRVFRRSSPWSAIRAARLVLWERAIKREVRRRAGIALQNLAPGALRWLRRRRHARLHPPWLVPADPALRATLEERHLNPAVVPLAPDEGAYVRAIRTLPQAPISLIEQDHAAAWADSLGFTLLYPYFDRDLVDLSMRMHPEHLIGGGRFKTPLRHLVGERLPTVAMPQKKVDFTRVYHQVFRAEGRRVWEALGGPVALAALGIVDARRLDAMMRDYLAGDDGLGIRPWLVLTTEAWLRARSGGRPVASGEQETPL